MPIVPEINSPRTSMDVPGPASIDMQAMNAPSKALGEAAGKISEFATSLAMKQKKAEDNDFAFKQFTDDYQAIEKKSAELKTSMPEDASGYSDAMNKFIADRQAGAEKLAPGQDALRLYHDKVGTLFKGASIDAFHFENTERAKYYLKSIDESANSLASTQLANPDPFKAKYIQGQLENNLEENAQTHFVGASQREAMKQKMRDQVSVAMYDGLGAKERYADQIKLLKNTDQDTDVFAGMDAKTRGSLLVRAQNGLETQARQGDAELKGRIADVQDALYKGEDVDAGTLTQLARRVAVSGFRPDEKEHYGEALHVAAVVSDQKKNLLQTNMNDWKSPQDILSVGADGANARVINKAQAVLGREMVSLRKEAKDDPAAYALKSSPALQQASGMISPGSADDTQNFDTNFLARQTALGIQSPALLTKMQAQQLAQNFINQPPDEAARSAVALKMSHGKYAPVVFAQIAKEGSAPPDAMLLAYAPNAQSVAGIMDNIKRAPDIKEAFEKQFPKLRDEKVREMVGSKMQPYAQALQNEGTSVLSLSNALQNQVTTEAKKRMLTNADTSMDDAVSHSIKSVVDSNFVPMNPANSHFLMPKYDGNGQPIKSDTVDAFVKAHSTRDGFKALDVAVPKAIQADFDARPKSNDLGRFLAPDETGQDRFYKMLEKSGYWTPSADNSELILSMRQGSKSIAVKDGQGNDIRKSLHEISNATDNLTLQAQLPWYSKLFKQNKAEAGN